MQVLLLLGSSKDDGFSRRLCDIFAVELKKHDNMLEVINLCGIEIASSWVLHKKDFQIDF